METVNLEGNAGKKKPCVEDIHNAQNSEAQFGKSELILLNLIAQIIVEYVLNTPE